MSQTNLFLPFKNAANAFAAGFVGKQNEQWVGQRHAANYEAVYSGGIGLVQNPSGVTTSAALATTYVGLCLSNPAGSGKNLVLLNVSGQLNVAPAALTSFALAVGYSAAGVVTHTTALTPLSGLVGTGPALIGLADSACTIVGTPANVMALGEIPAATSVFSFSRDINGAILLPPGAWAAITTSIAGPASGFLGSMLWEEVAQ